MKKIRVLLADDHATVRAGLKLLIDGQPDMEVVADVGDSHRALTSAAATGARVAVLDLSMPDMNGIAATRAMKTVSPRTAVVVLTRHTDAAYARESFEAGVLGYVLKQSPSAELLAAIRIAAEGGHFLDPVLGTAPGEEPEFQKSLANPPITERETDVLRLIAWGRSNKEIADKLRLSIKTVEAHRASALRKLGLRDRVDVLRLALLQGWLDDPE